MVELVTTVLAFAAWLIREHPFVALVLFGGLFGFGQYGATLQAAKLIPKWVPLLVLPVAAIWLLARKTKDGRRGIAIVGPWAVAIGGVALWWLVPDVRWKLATPLVAGGLVYAIVAVDQWLGLDVETGRHKRWTCAAFREAFERDEATLAFQAGVGVALGGRHTKVGRATTGPDGRSRVSARVPTGASVSHIEQAVRDGRFGAAANHYGMGVTDVHVVPGDTVGTFEVVGTVLGQRSPIDETHLFPEDEP